MLSSFNGNNITWCQIENIPQKGRPEDTEKEENQADSIMEYPK